MSYSPRVRSIIWVDSPAWESVINMDKWVSNSWATWAFHMAGVWNGSGHRICFRFCSQQNWSMRNCPCPIYSVTHTAVAQKLLNWLIHISISITEPNLLTFYLPALNGLGTPPTKIVFRGSKGWDPSITKSLSLKFQGRIWTYGESCVWSFILWIAHKAFHHFTMILLLLKNVYTSIWKYITGIIFYPDPIKSSGYFKNWY